MSICGNGQRFPAICTGSTGNTLPLTGSTSDLRIVELFGHLTGEVPVLRKSTERSDMCYSGAQWVSRLNDLY
jgi:hypothetical protein